MSKYHSIVIFMLCGMFLVSCSKKTHISLSQDELDNFYVPEGVCLEYGEKTEYGGIVFYQINEDFPPEVFLNDLGQFYKVRKWIPLNYKLFDALNKGGYYRDWVVGKIKDRPPGTSQIVKSWEQDWINKDADSLNVSIRYHDAERSNRVHVISSIIRAEYANKPLIYYRKIHGANDVKPTEEVIEMIKTEGFISFGFLFGNNGKAILSSSCTPYEMLDHALLTEEISE